MHPLKYIELCMINQEVLVKPGHQEPYHVLESRYMICSLELTGKTIQWKIYYYGEVECTVNTSHVSCRCASYNYDSVCKHSIAVAGKVGILEQHLKQITKASRIPRSGRRSNLVEANVNKNVAGKKGAKSKYPY